MLTLTYKEFLEMYALNYNLTFDETTTDISGKPKQTNWTIIGFEKFEDIKKHIARMTGTENSNIFKIVSLRATEDMERWAVEGEVTQPYDIENIYTDRNRYEIYTTEDRKRIIDQGNAKIAAEKDNKDFTFDHTMSIIKFMTEIWNLKEDEFVIRDTLQHEYFTLKKFSTRYPKDDIYHEIGIIAENVATSCYDD